MMLSDDELLHINGKEPEGYDPLEARRDLAEYGDTYRYQLVAAIHYEELAQMFTEQKEIKPYQKALGSPDYVDGLILAYSQVAGSLRCGDFLPGGLAFDLIAPPIRPSDEASE
jgi:hypothetical protein